MELLRPRLPTDEATKSIYHDIDTMTNKCITRCDCQLILFIINFRKAAFLFHNNNKIDIVKKNKDSTKKLFDEQ